MIQSESTREHQPVERRRYPRTRLSMALGCIRLDPDGGDVVDSLGMVDISRSGLGANCSRRYYPGQRIVLNLPLPANGLRKNIYATVIRCRETEGGSHEADGGSFRAGFEFDGPYVGTSFGHSEAAAAA